jgi:two-component system phosphate regulon response regulator PhoB
MTRQEKILVVDDEEDILELVQYNLVKEGYDVVCALTGEKALEVAASIPIDLIVLDLMLPGVDGLSVTQKLKNDPGTSDIPIVMLTARGEEKDVVTGLEMGADDYIPKPFSPRILMARIRSVLRRRAKAANSEEEASILEGHQLTVRPEKHEVYADGEPVQLTVTEFELLCFLMKRPGWVFTRSQIVDAIRGDHYAVTDRSVDVQMVGLRKKLGKCGKYIETVRGVGYRFKE